MTPQALDSFNVPADLDECQRMINELVAALKDAFGKLDERDGQIQELQERLQFLVRAKFGRMSETVSVGQLRLFAAPEAEVAPAEETPPEKKERVLSAGHGRKKPAKELPRRRVVHELPEGERGCPDCGMQRVAIGEEVSERYGYVPACVEVIEDARVRYGCPQCDSSTVVAAIPAKPIPKGLADGSMIAYIAVSKFADHLPLHRLEGIFRRHGAEIARSTMCDWLAAAADLLEPLYIRLKERVLCSRIIWTDDTPVDLQDRNHENNILQARIWTYLGDKQNDFTVFDFTDSRRRDGPVDFLKDFAGFLQADAYAGYDHVYASNTVHEVACWAHARRKFFDALGSDKKSASYALRHIQALYRVEKLAATKSDAQRQRMRRRFSTRILKLVKRWLDQKVVTEHKGPLSKAIKYALNNWDALCTFTQDGELTIDNNKSERSLRAVAVGRKNWLFVGSRDGGRRAAILSSLIASCKQHNVDPLGYLTYVLNLFSHCEPANLDGLLPDRWPLPA
jgi:transposase